MPTVLRTTCEENRRLIILSMESYLRVVIFSALAPTLPPHVALATAQILLRQR